MPKEKVTFTMGEDDLGRLDDLVETDNHFDTRSQAIRYALREFLQREGLPA